MEYVISDKATGNILTVGKRDFESEQEAHEFAYLHHQQGHVVDFEPPTALAEAAEA